MEIKIDVEEIVKAWSKIDGGFNEERDSEHMVKAIEIGLVLAVDEALLELLGDARKEFSAAFKGKNGREEFAAAKEFETFIRSQLSEPSHPRSAIEP